MSIFEDYNHRIKLAEAMIDRAPNAMERELNKKGIRENMTSEYYRIAADKLSKYRLQYRDEADLKVRLRINLQALENSYMQNKWARLKKQQ